MSKLDKAYLSLLEMERKDERCPSEIDPRVSLITTVVYLAAMLSVPVGRLSMLIWFAIIPIVGAAWHGMAFGPVFRRSLVILPFVALIGMFNPIFDREPAFRVAGVAVTSGWLSFISIMLRGVLAMQCVLVLVGSTGFRGMCRAMRQLGVPAFLTDQLQFVYRYMAVLLLESITMRDARRARGYGRKSYPLRLWGVMTGQLFLRSVARAERINTAMTARGFTGTLPEYRRSHRRIRTSDVCYLLVMTGAILLFRLTDLSTLFFT